MYKQEAAYFMVCYPEQEGTETMRDPVSYAFPPGYNGTAILEQLDQVLDPELDESILQLGFVRALRVDADHVTVALQLPTSWCAVNFAFLMADDIRRALLMLKGITRVTVQLGDHCTAEAIETAVQGGHSFAAAFPDAGDESLEVLRLTFRRKGFLSRQERLLRDLQAAGYTPEAICALRLSDAVAADGTCLLRPPTHVPDDRSPPETLRRYLQRRAEFGLDCTRTAPLIIDLDGQPLPVARLQAYYQHARTVRVALEANGAFCRAMLAARQPPCSLHPSP